MSSKPKYMTSAEDQLWFVLELAKGETVANDVISMMRTLDMFVGVWTKFDKDDGSTHPDMNHWLMTAVKKKGKTGINMCFQSMISMDHHGKSEWIDGEVTHYVDPQSILPSVYYEPVTLQKKKRPFKCGGNN